MDTKTIVITGASSGIGATLAVRLGAQGHRLVLAARREHELSEVAAACGGASLVVPADVCRRQNVERIRDRAIERFGHVDVWVNNAGRGIGRRVLELTDEEFEEMIAVNLKSALYGMQTIVPHFLSRGCGHLINVSSFLSRVPVAATFRSAYSAAKAALNILTANLRIDLQHQCPDVRVSLVIPGVVTTPFAANALGGTPVAPPASGPARPQTAEEVAAAIMSVIDNPVAELYTNPALHDIAQQYYRDVGAFETGHARPRL